MASTTDGDIVDRLRRWCVSVTAAPASDLMDEAADVIESLRQEIRTQRGEIGVLRARLRSISQADRPFPNQHEGF